MYWLTDNIHILMKVCNLNKIYPTVHLSHKVKTCAKYFWLAGLSLFLLICCKILRKTYTDESDLKVAALNKMTVQQVMDNLKIIGKLRDDYWLNFSRAFLDLIVCLNEVDLPFKVLGKRLSPGFEGVFGMSSALIYLYGLRRVNKNWWFITLIVEIWKL